MTHRLLVLVLLASVGLALPASGQTTAGTVDVATVHGSAIEHQAREQLLRIVSTWDLSPWLFTRTVQIDEDVADRTLRSWRHYPWVYRQVLENPDPIRAALRRFGIDDPDARR